MMTKPKGFRRYIYGLAVLAAAVCLVWLGFFLNGDDSSTAKDTGGGQNVTLKPQPDLTLQDEEKRPPSPDMQEQERGRNVRATMETPDTERLQSPNREVTSVPEKDAPNTDVIGYLRDGGQPLKARRDFIRQLAQQTTPAAWQALRAVAEADIYLSHVAINVMHNAKCADRDTIASYLRGRLLAPDPRVARAAMDSYARTIGIEAVKPICEAVEKGRETDHAFFDQVAEAGYTSLGALAAPEAVPFLAAESLKVGPKLDRGSTIVKALSNIIVPEARDAILNYADNLEGRLPEKPMERAYYKDKITEARALAEKMGL